MLGWSALACGWKACKREAAALSSSQHTRTALATTALRFFVIVPNHMDWSTLVERLGTFGIGAAALSYLITRLIEHSLSKDLDRFKTSLQSEHDVAIERLRADLRVVAFTAETKMASLLARRAEVIAELYRKLAEFHSAFSDFLRPLQTGGKEAHIKRGESSAKLGTEFFSFFNTNRIYFAESFCARVDELNTIFMRVWADFDYGSGEIRGKEWIEAWKRFEKEVPPLRREIEHMLRSMIGVSDEAPKGSER
jgi:hypothetical protein